MVVRHGLFCIFLVTALNLTGKSHHAIVADSSTLTPLSNASIFDRTGALIGISNVKGTTPYIDDSCLPITIRYIGYREKSIDGVLPDTIFLAGVASELPELVVESRQHKVLHILAYVREYSTLSTYTDTVFLFREKMVDFMLNPEIKSSFKGWNTPRIIKTRSYYRFTDATGLDSVSDSSPHHFSWSDWMGMPPPVAVPPHIHASDCAADTIFGQYSAAETWSRHDSRVSVDINILADTITRKWIPSLRGFFNDNIEFENFRIRYNYDNIAAGSVAAADLASYAYNIDSRGRGRSMFRFNRKDEPLFVSTYAEVYIIDKEYITIKEAKKWEKNKFDAEGIEIIEPREAPELQPHIRNLIARVDTIDSDKVRLNVKLDPNIGSGRLTPRNFGLGERALSMLKILTGITRYKYNKKLNNEWNKFRNKNRKNIEIQRLEEYATDSLP